MSKYVKLSVTFHGKPAPHQFMVRAHQAPNNFELTEKHVKKIVTDRFGNEHSNIGYTYEQKAAKETDYDKTTFEKVSVPLQV